MHYLDELESELKSNLGKIREMFGDNFTPTTINIIRAYYLHCRERVYNYPYRCMSNEIPFNKGHCIYFLMSGDYVVYVGQTANLCARVGQHISDGKKFNCVSHFPTEEDELLIQEAFNIHYHNPELNKTSPTIKELLIMVVKHIL